MNGGATGRTTTSIGPAPVALTALGTATERAPGTTSTVMPSTIRPAAVVATAGAGRNQVPVS
jgi:hypothetical protein